MKKKPVTRKPVPVELGETLTHRVPVTPEYDIDALSIPDLESVQRKVVAALKRIDNSLNDALRRTLVQRITQDLNDPEKCTPGLYQAALRLIGEELGGSDLEGTVTGSRVNEIRKSVPFKATPLVAEMAPPKN